MENDPVYQENFQRAEHQINALIESMQGNGNGAQLQIMGDTLEIPVVVHVIHTGQSVGVGANISTAQIEDAIDVLNDRYRKTPSTHGDAAGVDTKIQFVLAKRDPDCNTTTGIVRVDGSGVTNYASEGITVGQGSGADELAVKNLSRWPATDYLNIWVITEIEDNNGSFGIQGYAYFPGITSAYDGVVIMHTCFGTIGTVNSWNNLNRTLAHEVGHYLDLYHTFEGDNNGGNCPGTTNGCGSGSGDCCGDTEPHIRAASNCPTGTNGCTSAAWDDVQHNYMNYSSQTCADMFTQDQSDRMRAALFGPRASLLTSLGTETPSGLSVTAADCTPSTGNLSNAFGIGIINVTFEDIDVTSGSSVPDSGYRDFTCHQIQEVFPSTAYNISIKTGAANDEDVRVFIDYNDDGDFEDSGEAVFSNDTDTLHAGSFTIPSNPTLNVPLRMRVLSDWAGNTTALNSGGSCYNPTYGQAEDYAILVKGSMSASASGSNVSCFGSNDGSATATVSSGAANYNYSWSNGDSTSNSSSSSNTITGLTAGTYTVTVTDANALTATASYTITQPSSALLSSVTVNQMVSCFGGNNGSMSASASGGSGSFTYAWNNSTTTVLNAGLLAGTYSVTISDANGCTDSASSTISQPSSGITASVAVDSNVSCNGGSDGGLTASQSGGTSPYTYSWSNSSTTSFIVGIGAGTYTVTITDANACSSAGSNSITEPTSLSASISVVTNVSCGSSDGALSVSGTGGTVGYNYAWSNGGTSSSISSLTSGIYSATVTDANGCTTSTSETLTSGASLSLSIATDSNVSCNGTSSGGLTASISGGTSPYTYAWSNGATTPSVTGLAAGTYTITVSENGGCSATSSATITQPPALTSSITLDSNVSCSGGANGGLTTSASGGTSSYSFAWSNGSTSATIVGLTAGTYSVTISDANGCSSTISATVTQPSSSLFTMSLSATNANCNGSSDGSINLTVSGGTSPFSYVWSNAAISEDLSGIPAGNYTVTVTDNTGCSQNTSQAITEPSAVDGGTIITN
jgi:hypothetical protein